MFSKIESSFGKKKFEIIDQHMFDKKYGNKIEFGENAIFALLSSSINESVILSRGVSISVEDDDVE